MTLSVLEEEIKALEAQITKDEGGEEQEEKQDIPSEERETDNDDGEETSDSDGHDGAADDTDDEAEPKNNSDWAKHRIKLKQEREARHKLELELAELRGRATTSQQVVAPKVEETKQPEWMANNPFDKDLEPDNHALWIENRLIAAKQDKLDTVIKQQNEMQVAQQLALRADRAEADAVAKLPEYHEVKQFLVEKELASIRANEVIALRRKFPGAPIEKIHEFLDNDPVAKQKLTRDAQGKVDTFIIGTAAAGVDLADHIQSVAGNYGYQARQPTEKRSDLEALKRNKRKSGSLIGTSGKSTGSDSISMEEAVEMSLADFDKLDKTKIRGYSAAH